MQLTDITPVILTFNEEANLPRVLRMLEWCSRIVVVDSLSTDRTAAIASDWPQVSVLQRRFDSHENQWNFGLQQVQTEWALTLDADYVLSPHLISELSERASSLDDRDGYYARFHYCVNGQPLRGSLYPPRLVLFRVRKAKYVSDGHTQRLQLDGAHGTLSGPIYHDDRKPLSAWLEAQQRYTKLEVQKLTSTSAWQLSAIDRIRRRKFFAPFLAPAYCLFAKGLLFDGRAGLFYTLQRTYAEILLSLRLFEADAAQRLAQKEQKTAELDG